MLCLWATYKLLIFLLLWTLVLASNSGTLQLQSAQKVTWYFQISVPDGPFQKMSLCYSTIWSLRDACLRWRAWHRWRGTSSHLYLTAKHGGAAEPRITAFKVDTHSSQGGCEELVSPEPCYQTLSPNKIKWHVYNCGKHSKFLGGMVGWTEKENRISNYCGNVYIEITCSVSVLHLKYLFFSFKHGHILLCVIWL